jgi:hypothetical protein
VRVAHASARVVPSTFDQAYRCIDYCRSLAGTLISSPLAENDLSLSSIFVMFARTIY